ncbi:PucR family transcriptional regulator [Clostridium sp. UBA4548]|uniref:PucR family transcriptional regulator n=1 Tax=Clostridium sp. UBA4548 TaxID=1946361 RepID=UPI0025C738B8|nr:helix-turn-helix domain-containing protein [Clostridium sp. UBA4548]
MSYNKARGDTMIISIVELFERLRKTYLGIKDYNIAEPIDITDIEFITKDFNSNKNQILYLGKSSQLLNFHGDMKGSFILINDVDLSTKLKNCNYVLVDCDEDLFELWNYIKTLFMKQMYTSNPATSLLNSLAQGKGLKYLLQIGAENINNPIILIDGEFSVLAYSTNKEIKDSLWKENIEVGYCSYEFIAAVKKIKSVKESPLSIEPYKVVCDESNINKFVSKVIIHGKVVAYLLLLQEEGEVLEEHLNIFKVLNSAITEELKSNSTYKNIKGVKYENLLLDLLEGKITEEAVALERMKSAECNFGEEIHVLLMDISNYTLNGKDKNLKASIEEELIGSKSIFYKDDILILLDKKHKNQSLDQVLESFLPFLKKKKLVIAVSGKTTRLTEIKDKYFEAKNTMNYAKKINKESFIHKYKDFKFYDILNKVEDNLLKYCNEDVLRLMQFDKENSTEYCKTLKIYMESNQNINMTANKLFIHRNTLSYRISKIKELLSMDFREGEHLFEILYTFRILEFLEKI